MGLTYQEASKKLIEYFRYQLPHVVWSQYYDIEKSDLNQLLATWHQIFESQHEIPGNHLIVTFQADLPALKKSILEKIYNEWIISDIGQDPFVVLTADLKADRVQEFLKHPSKFKISQLHSDFPRYVEDFLIATSQSGRSLTVALQRLLLEKSDTKNQVVNLAESFFFPKDEKLKDERFKKAQNILKWLDELDNKES